MIYPSRSAFSSAWPVHALLDDAADVRAVGLSLNLLCQQYSDTSLANLAARGAKLRLLLLDPGGESVKQREREEGHPDGHLSTLTQINLSVLHRVRERLPEDQRANLQLAVYDETVRFNIILVDERLCVVQPYLPHARGVESPTLLIERGSHTEGLYAVYEQAFTSLWSAGRSL